MFDKKAIILIASLAGLLVIALTTTILLDSKSEPIAFENDYSETSSVGGSYDEEAGFDSDFDDGFDSDFDPDFDSDFDDDFDDESDDFDVRMNYDSTMYVDSIEVNNFKEFKNAFDLKFDLLDVEKYFRKKYPEDHYQLKDIIIDKNEKTASGYNAIVRVDLEGYDTVLRQEVTLSYDLDETFNNWDYKGYELNGTETIYSDLKYFDIEHEKIPSEVKGTFVYEAINRDLADNRQYRKLYVYNVAQGTAMGYEVSESCMVLVNNRIVSVDVIHETGDTSLQPRYPVKYVLSDNGLRRESDNRLVFTYNENGGLSEERTYVRVSDNILSPEQIVEIWVNNN